MEYAGTLSNPFESFMDRTSEIISNIGEHLSDFFYNAKESLGEFFSGVGEKLKVVFNPEKIKEALVEFWTKLGDFCRNGVDLLKTGLSKVGEGFVWLGGKLRDFGSAAWETIKEFSGAAWDKIKDFSGVVWDKMKDFGVAIKDGLVNFGGFLKDKFTSAYEWAKERLPQLGEKFKEVLSRTREFCGNMATKIGEFTKNACSKIRDFSGKCVEGLKTLKEKLGEKFEQVAPKVKEFFSNAKDKIAAGVAVAATAVKNFGEKFKNFTAGVKERLSEKIAVMKANAQARREAREQNRLVTGKDKTKTKTAPKTKTGAAAGAIAAAGADTKGTDNPGQAPKAPKVTKVVPQPPKVEKPSITDDGKDPVFEEEPDIKFNDAPEEDAVSVWSRMKHDLQTREIFSSAFNAAIGDEKGVDNFIASMDRLIEGNKEKFANLEEYDTLEELLDEIAITNPEFEGDVSVIANSMDKIAGAFKDEKFSMEAKGNMYQFLDKYDEDFIEIDAFLGYGMEEAIDTYGKQLEALEQTPVEKNPDDNGVYSLIDEPSVPTKPLPYIEDPNNLPKEQPLPYIEDPNNLPKEQPLPYIRSIGGFNPFGDNGYDVDPGFSLNIPNIANDRGFIIGAIVFIAGRDNIVGACKEFGNTYNTAVSGNAYGEGGMNFQ